MVNCAAPCLLCGACVGGQCALRKEKRKAETDGGLPVLAHLRSRGLLDSIHCCNFDSNKWSQRWHFQLQSELERASGLLIDSQCHLCSPICCFWSERNLKCASGLLIDSQCHLCCPICCFWHERNLKRAPGLLIDSQCHLPCPLDCVRSERNFQGGCCCCQRGLRILLLFCGSCCVLLLFLDDTDR
jgi:hypothetical protein